LLSFLEHNIFSISSKLVTNHKLTNQPNQPTGRTRIICLNNFRVEFQAPQAQGNMLKMISILTNLSKLRYYSITMHY